ncbi:MAG: PIN domain-containing protein, partial [Desulfurococcales archaeon]|nr:PIN domain-containing protein [Desulfurococcales archaeon]
SVALIRVKLHTVAELLEELEEHWNKILKYTRLPTQLLNKFYNTIINTITIHTIDMIPVEIIERAKELVKDVDPNDWPFVALAMFLDAPLWTGDHGLLKLSTQTGFKHFTAVDTEGVEMLLREKPLESVKERMREKYDRDNRSSRVE